MTDRTNYVANSLLFAVIFALLQLIAKFIPHRIVLNNYLKKL